MKSYTSAFGVKGLTNSFALDVLVESILFSELEVAISSLWRSRGFRNYSERPQIRTPEMWPPLYSGHSEKSFIVQIHQATQVIRTLGLAGLEGVHCITLSFSLKLSSSEN